MATVSRSTGTVRELLDDPQHLIATTASANPSKGARRPDEWKPENRAYWCRYATDLITIKSTWDLTVTKSELSGSNQMFTPVMNCPASGFRATVSLAYTAPRPDQNPVRPQQQRQSSTAHATRHRQREKPVCRAAKKGVKDFPSGWYPAPETATESSVSNDTDGCTILQWLVPQRSEALPKS